MYIGLHVKYPLFLPGFNETWIFSTDFGKVLKISDFMKILQEVAELFHADGRTDMTKRMVALRNLANAFKSEGPCQNMKDSRIHLL
jgi:hypothetical protein